MSYRCIAAASDWFYVVRPDSADTNTKPGIHRIAVWAQTESGEVIGLVGVTRGDVKINCLEPIPKLRGVYKHLNDLTAEERSSGT